MYGVAKDKRKESIARSHSSRGQVRGEHGGTRYDTSDVQDATAGSCGEQRESKGKHRMEDDIQLKVICKE